MSDDDHADPATARAFAGFVRSTVERTEDYLRRGRRFEALPNDALAALWINGMRAWAGTVHPRPTDLDDADAEFALRGMRPPYELAASELRTVIAAADAAFDALCDEQRAVAFRAVVAAYAKARRRLN